MSKMETYDPFVAGDQVPECISSCLAKAVATVDCNSDQSCWCVGNNEQGIKDALNLCYKEKPSACAEDLFGRMRATVDLICDQKRTSSSLPSSSTSAGTAPSATTSSDAASNGGNGTGLSNTTLIGMSAGLGVAGLIILVLLFLFLRERRRRKRDEFKDNTKRSMSKQSTLHPDHMSPRDSVATKQTNTHSVDVPVWRPGRVQSPPMPVPAMPSPPPQSTGTPVQIYYQEQGQQQQGPRKDTTPYRETGQYNGRRDQFQDRDTFVDPRLAHELPP